MKKLLVLFITFFFIKNLFSQTQRNALELFNQGQYFLDNNEYVKANEKLKSATLILEKVLNRNDTSLADCISYLAYSYLLIGKKNEALKYYTKAYNIYNLNNKDHHLNYRVVLCGIAKINHENSNFYAAEKYYSDYLDLINFQTDSSAYILTLIDLIDIYENTTQYLKLASILKKLVLIYPQDDKFEYQRLLIQLAEVCSNNKDKDAEEYFQLALKFNDSNFDDDNYLIQKYFILNDYASFYFGQGQYLQAEQKYLETLEIKKLIKDSTFDDNVGTYYNLALVYQKLYNFEKAKKYILNAIDQIKLNTVKDSVLIGQCKIALASIKKDNHEDLFEVIQLNKEAIKILKIKEGEYGQDYINAVQNLANVYCLQNENKKAIPMYLEVIDKRKKTLGINHPEYAKALANLGAAYNDLNDLKSAKYFFQETLNNYKNNFQAGAEQLTYIYNSLANLYEKQKDTSNHLLFQLNSIKSLNRGNINNLIALSETEKLNYLESINEYYNQFKSTFYKFGQKKSSFLEEAYNNEMQNKSFTLKSTIEIKNKVLSSGDTSLINNYNLLLIKKEIIAKNYSLPINIRVKNLNNIESEAEDLEKKISQKIFLYPYVNQTLKYTFKDVRSRLKSDETAIEFISFRYYKKNITDSVIYGALIIKPDFTEPKFIYLFEEKELENILKNDETLTNVAFINRLYLGNKITNTLYGLIWRPLDTLINQSNNIFISPTGLLNKVSFSAIPFSDTITLGEKYNLKILGTTSDIINSNSSQLNKDSLNAMIFGGIDYENAEVSKIEQNQIIDTANQFIKDKSSYVASWKYLIGSKKESIEINKQFNQVGISAILYSDSMATETRFKSLPKVENMILHIATHGYFYPDLKFSDSTNNNEKNKSEFKISKNPLFRSGLIFAGANFAWSKNYNTKYIDDGILTSYEVSNCDLRNIKLVVLSACETGLGQIKGDEGVFGLQRSFKLAGVKNLIMSLWKVSDEKTSEFMFYFYFKLLERYSINDAFKFAKKEMQKKYPKMPFYWAGFILLQ